MKQLSVTISKTFLALSIVLTSSSVIASNYDNANIDDLLEMSIEDLTALETTIASGKSTSIFKSVSTVSVITREDIAKYHFRSVSDALQTIAGFDVTRTYFKKNLPTSRGILQDHYANKVLVMINNIPTWHAATGEGNIDRVNIHDIEKIEVLKGPASVLYGTNAYAGAINIVLKKVTQNKSQVYAGFGSHGQRMVGGSQTVYSEEKDASLFVSFNTEKSDKHGMEFVDETDVSGHFEDFINTQNLSIHGTYKDHSFLINTYNNTEAYLGVAPRYSFGLGNDHELEGYLLGYQYEHALDDASNIKLSTKLDWNKRSFSRSADNDTRGETWGYHTTSTITYNRAFMDNFYFDVGLDHDYRETSKYRNFLASTDQTLTHNNMKNKSIWEYSVFSHIGYDKDKWKWDIGLRNVENELFDDSLSGRATLVYSISDKSSLKFIVGQSYRSPSLFELNFITPGQTVFGNPDLLPEESTSYEMAYLRSLGDFFIQTTAYYATYSNKIYRERGDVTLPDNTVVTNTNVYANGDDFNVLGVEIEGRYQGESLSSFLNLNFQKGGDGDQVVGTDHYNYKYIPDYTISGGLSKNIEQFTVALVGNYRDDMGNSTSQNIDSSLTLDLSASYNSYWGESGLAKHIVSFSNLTDEDVDMADYVRRKGLQSVPVSSGRAIMYELMLSF